jgi:hypothetical protein
VAAVLSAVIAFLLVTGSPAGAAERPGVAPADPWSCPASHPIKGYVSHESERRVYFVPGSPFYDEASPERCYGSEDEARGDGSRPAPDPRPFPSSGSIVRLGADLPKTPQEPVRVTGSTPSVGSARAGPFRGGSGGSSETPPKRLSEKQERERSGSARRSVRAGGGASAIPSYGGESGGCSDTPRKY